jgi:hypothetical protein
VQEYFFQAAYNPAEFDADEHVLNIEPRSTVAENGEPIAEWTTTVPAIRQFLDAADDG